MSLARLPATYLHMVGEEDRACQTSCHAADDVDEADADPAGKLLEVSHDEDLEPHADQQLDDPATQHHTNNRLELKWRIIS